MIRLTIIRDDNIVYVDGVPYQVDCSTLPPEYHAIQWYGAEGDIEIKDPTKPYHYAVGNRKITDLSPFQSYIDAWTLAKERYRAAAQKAPLPPGATVNVIS